MNWRPWDEVDRSVLRLGNIKEPPCKECKFFTPRIKTLMDGVYAGVVICSAGKMEHDFSCFDQREPEKPYTKADFEKSTGDIATGSPADDMPCGEC